MVGNLVDNVLCYVGVVEIEVGCDKVGRVWISIFDCGFGIFEN